MLLCSILHEIYAAYLTFEPYNYSFLQAYNAAVRRRNGNLKW